MTQELAEALEETADHLVLAGKENEARAYRQAADTVRNTDIIPADPAELTGVGDTIRDNILEFQRQGEIGKLEVLREEYPYLSNLRVVDGIGGKTAKRIHEELGITQVGGLKERQNELPEVHGIGKKTADNIVQGVDDYIDGVTERKPIEEAQEKMIELTTILFHGFEDECVEDEDSTYLPFNIVPSGSFRRREDTVGDLDVLVIRDMRDNPVPPEVTPAAQEIWDVVTDEADRTLNRGPTKCSVILDGMQVDLLLVPAESYGAAMNYFTGPKSYNIKMRKIAQEQGYKLNEYGLFDESGEKIAGESERKIYDELGVKYHHPPERHPDLL